MSTSNTSKPAKLVLTHLPAIHAQDAKLGKTLQQIADYINLNVTPKQGNKVQP